MGSGQDFPFPVTLADPVCPKTPGRIPRRRHPEDAEGTRKQILPLTPGTPAPCPKAITEAGHRGWRSTPCSLQKKFALSITKDPPVLHQPQALGLLPVSPPALGCRGCHAPHAPLGSIWGAANHPPLPPRSSSATKLHFGGGRSWPWWQGGREGRKRHGLWGNSHGRVGAEAAVGWTGEHGEAAQADVQPAGPCTGGFGERAREIHWKKGKKSW